MGDWQNNMSMNGGHSPWDSPCWNDDWERELLEDGYSTVEGWNAQGRIVMKGAKGMFLPCARLMVFSEAQTEPSKHRSSTSESSTNTRFQSFAAASEWAKRNPGRSITAAPDGVGYISK